MEDSSKNLEKWTTEWVREAGLDKPSVDFTTNVMEAIEVHTQTSKTYRPLISKSGWALVAALFMVSLIAVFLLPMGEMDYLSTFNLPELPAVSNPFENLQVSTTMLYGIVFLSLFLLQIPFLKRKYIN